MNEERVSENKDSLNDRLEMKRNIFCWPTMRYIVIHKYRSLCKFFGYCLVVYVFTVVHKVIFDGFMLFFFIEKLQFSHFIANMPTVRWQSLRLFDEISLSLALPFRSSLTGLLWMNLQWFSVCVFLAMKYILMLIQLNFFDQMKL